MSRTAIVILIYHRHKPIEAQRQQSMVMGPGRLGPKIDCSAYFRKRGLLIL
jgi:hypothetical protein